MSTMITRYKAARRVGTPLIAISTADQPATVIDLIRATAAKVPVVTWDIVRGWLPGNDPGRRPSARRWRVLTPPPSPSTPWRAL